MKIKVFLGLICLLLALSFISLADASPASADELFPDLSGADLQLKIAEEYIPDRTLGYRKGRDVLYIKIDN